MPSDLGSRFLKKHAEPTLLLKEGETPDSYDFEIFDMPKKNDEPCSSSTHLKYVKQIHFYRKKYLKLLSKFKKIKAFKANKMHSAKKVKDAIEKLPNISAENKTFCNLLLSSRSEQYSKDVRELIQNIFYVSQSTYNFLRNKLNLNLPHVSSINRWAPIKFLQPGFKNTAFDAIKQKCSELQDVEKNNMVLLLDEMAIRRELRYNLKLDIVDGFEDNGFSRTNNVGKYICVFMVKSLFPSWSIIMNYFVSKNGLTSLELNQIIMENLKILSSLGVTVKVITCDQGSSNRKFYSDSGISVENPFFIFNQKKVYCLFDFPHLIKSLRNGWLHNDLETLDGKVSFKVVEEMWENENGATTKMCPKLSERHINPSSFDQMKVKLATQIFSRTVAAAIKTINDTKGFKTCSREVASSTAVFIEKIDKIFDCLNSGSLYSSSPYKCALKFNNESFKYLEYFKMYLNEIKFVDKSKKVFFLNGMAQTINGISMFAGELFTQKDVFFLMTRKLNQDKLENTFAVLRQKGGHNTNPSVAEINVILARVMCSKIIQKSTQANCETFDDNSMECISSILQEIETEKKENILEEPVMQADYNLEIPVNNPKDDFLCVENVDTDSASLRYFLGYVAYKVLPEVDCLTCTAEIRKEEEILTVPSELFIFHKSYNNIKDFGCLIAPSQKFFDVSKIHASIFQNIFTHQPHMANIKKTIIENCINSTPEWFDNCLEHKKRLLDFFILVLLRKHCAWATKENKVSRTQKKLKIING